MVNQRQGHILYGTWLTDGRVVRSDELVLMVSERYMQCITGAGLNIKKGGHNIMPEKCTLMFNIYPQPL